MHVDESPSASLRVIAVDRLADLDPHAAAWDTLAGGLPQCLPMSTHAWSRTLLEQVIEPDGEWVALLAYEGDDLVGVLLAALETRRVLGMRRVAARVPAEYHTEDGDVVLRSDRASVALQALLGALRERVPGLLRLDLGAVREDSPTCAALDALPRGFSAVREPAVGGSVFDIQGDVETWFSGLSKNLRSDLKRSRNKARKAGLGEPVISFLTGADAPEDLLATLERLEASGWKGQVGTAIACDETKREKYARLVRRFAAHDMLEWHRLELGGQVAAMHLAVRMGPGLMLLRQGLDQDLARYGPGNHLIRAMVEREFERGGREVNLVTDYPWCRRWRMRLVPYEKVVILPRGPLPWLVAGLPMKARNLGRVTPGVRRAVRWLRERREGTVGTPGNR